ncbi:hypothetical protein ACN42_g10239 [Penicillium freii]|uniref:Uncharacterized protein n=1 Tax=Penicillium freii TaxID=48697 RepID=A0A101MAE5_PENFR|nr:hypothetical protein ACN42_g10239 [Penicillium freii]
MTASRRRSRDYPFLQGWKWYNIFSRLLLVYCLKWSIRSRCKFARRDILCGTLHIRALSSLDASSNELSINSRARKSRS